MHALIGIITRVLGLAGVLTIDYPFFSTIDRTASPGRGHARWMGP